MLLGLQEDEFTREVRGTTLQSPESQRALYVYCSVYKAECWPVVVWGSLNVLACCPYEELITTTRKNL